MKDPKEEQWYFNDITDIGPSSVSYFDVHDFDIYIFVCVLYDSEINTNKQTKPPYPGKKDLHPISGIGCYWQLHPPSLISFFSSFHLFYSLSIKYIVQWIKSRNLGVIFDSHLELKDHVSKVVQSAWVGVRKVGHLRMFLNPLSSEKLVHAFITSHLDYCNSLLSGLPDKDISRLQRIQNASARIIKCAKRSDSISRLLQDLHWLPVHLRVKFKILLTMYKCVNGSAPDYLCELISSYTPARRLRSLSQSLAVQPKVASKTYGERSFSFMGPFLWNSLPTWIRTLPSIPSLKKHLKTYLYKQQ